MILSRLTALFCGMFAVLLLFLVQSPGDGVWSLYANQLREGLVLYRDIKYSQQPIFLLITLFGSSALPDIYIFQRAVYLFVPLLYVYSIYKISEYCRPLLLRPVYIITVFFTAIHFEAYRFDDYHAFCGALIFYSIYLTLLRLSGRLSLSSYSVAQWFLISTVLFTRLNDGIALVIFYVALIYAQQGFGLVLLKKIVGLLVFIIIYLYFLLSFLGASFVEWSDMTIFTAAKIKGGDAGLFVSLYKLYENTIEFILRGWSSGTSLYMLGSILLFFGLDRSTPASYRNCIACLVSIFFIYAYQISHSANIVYAAIPYAFIITTFVVFFLFAKWVYSGFDAAQATQGNLLLLLMPFLLFLSGSVSSAGAFGDSYYQLALFLLLMVIVDFKSVFPSARTSVWVIFFTIIYLATAANSFLYRVINPYSWHAYHAPIFGGAYELVDDIEGVRFAPKELRSLVEPVCKIIESNNTLLSIPFSYANYHCRVKPWGGYVQTFFDTSSKELIDDMLGRLNRDPPDYIFYQRQEFNLAAHELIFNSGKDLPHRNLDRLIMANLKSKKWKIVYSSSLYPPSEWMLIKTKK